MKDMKKRKVDIACLQETKWMEDKTFHLKHGTGNIINHKATNRAYGMGFYMNKTW